MIVGDPRVVTNENDVGGLHEFNPPAIATPSTTATTGTGLSATAAQAREKLTNSSCSPSAPTARKRSTSAKSPG